MKLSVGESSGYTKYNRPIEMSSLESPKIPLRQKERQSDNEDDQLPLMTIDEMVILSLWLSS